MKREKRVRHVRAAVDMQLTLVLIVFVLAQSFSVAFVSKYTQKSRVENTQNVVSEITSFFSAKAEVLETVQTDLRQSGYPFEYLTSSEQERSSVKSDLIRHVQTMRSFITDQLYVEIRPNSGIGWDVSGSFPDADMARMNELLDAFRQSLSGFETKTKYYFLISGEQPNNLYFFCFQNVLRFDYEHIKTDSAGVVIVCLKVNLDLMKMQSSFWKQVSLNVSCGDDIISLYNQDDSGGYLYTYSQPIEDTAWYLSGSLKKSETENAMFVLLVAVLLETGIISFLLIMTHRFITRKISQPLAQTAAFVSSLESISDAKKLSIRTGYELDCIADQINSMLDTLHRNAEEIIQNQDRLYELTLSQKEAVLISLQEQVNPHFLFNSLACIHSIAVQKNEDDISDISTAISDLMRYTLSAANIVSLREELDNTMHYLDIMYIRYPDQFSVDLSIPEELMSLSVPKMVVQPLVENAFKYGLLDARQCGYLSVSAVSVRGFLCISVRNSGGGFPEDQLKQYRKMLKKISPDPQTAHIGLLNINKRIKLIFGNRYGLTIHSAPGKYCEIRAFLPNGGKES